MVKKNVRQVIENYPKKFSLRAFPDSTFALSYRKTFIDHEGTAQLVIVILDDSVRGYSDFCRCTVAELDKEIVKLVSPTKESIDFEKCFDK